MALEPGGAIGLHEAVSPQLLLVVDGAGRVRSGNNAAVAIAAGEGVLWQAGELHETTTERGLGAIVVEGSSLELLQSRPQARAVFGQGPKPRPER